MVVAAIKNDGNDDDNADVSKDADDEEDLRKEVQPCSPCPNIPAYILYLPPSHSVRILSDSSCIYAAIRSICIGFNDGFVYIFTIHPEQVLYNAIYKILAGDRQCDIQQLTCKNSRKCFISNLYVFESPN